MFVPEQYAYHNRMQGIHPGEKTVLVLAMLALVLWDQSITTSLVVLALMASLVTVGAGVPITTMFKLMSIPAAFLFPGTLAVAVTMGSLPLSPLWSITMVGATITITGAGLAQAGELAARSLAATSCLYFLALTTPLVELLQLLRCWRIPEILLELASLTYRMIFMLLATAEEIYRAQACRLGYATLGNGYRSLALLGSGLLIRTLQRYRQLIMGLESRGFQGGLPVLPLDLPPLRWWPWVLGLTGLVLAVAVGTG